jgi:hypothetical protein
MNTTETVKFLKTLHDIKKHFIHIEELLNDNPHLEDGFETEICDLTAALARWQRIQEEAFLEDHLIVGSHLSINSTRYVICSLSENEFGLINPANSVVYFRTIGKIKDLIIYIFEQGYEISVPQLDYFKED